MLSVFVISFCLVFIIWREYYKKVWYKDVKVSLKFSNDAIYAGEHTKLIEVIENRKKLPLPILEVGFHTKKELVFHNADNTYVSDNTYKRDIFSCLGRQKITRQIDVKGKKRGFYEISNADIMSFSLLHDRQYSKSLDSKASLYVYPARVKIDDILVICEKMTGSLQCKKHLYEDPFAFRSIREYTIDDPMKTINWKASARTGKLMVNTFDSVLSQKVFLFLDLEDSSILKHEHLVEYSISSAATLAWKLLSKNMEFGIASNSNISLESASGKKQMATIEKMLAMYQETDLIRTKNFESIITEYDSKFEKDSDVIFIFISKNSSEAVASCIDKFIGDNRQGIWICPYTMADKKELDNLNLIKCGIHNKNLKMIFKEVAK